MDTPHPYDLFVIGAGPGGYTAALLGARKGLRVGIAEGAQCGGTCPNRGCIPAKSYIESVGLLARMGSAQRFGLDPVKASLSLENLHRRKTRIVTRLVKGIEHLLRQAGVDVYPGYARFTGERSLLVDEAPIEASSIIIATGSRPKRPALFDVPGLLTSDEIFDVRSAPASLLIVGGGVMGMEMAHIFSHLGAGVTVVESLERGAGQRGRGGFRALVSAYRKIRFVTSARVVETQREHAVFVTVETPRAGRPFMANSLLLCIGREAVLPRVCPARHRVGTVGRDPGGRRHADEPARHLRGGRRHGRTHVRPCGIQGGRGRVSARILGDTKGPLTIRPSHSVVFTHPEVASVGRSTGGAGRKAGTFPVSFLGRARTMEESEGFATVHCSPEGSMERVTIVAPQAPELISLATLAVQRRLRVEEFLAPCYPNPTWGVLKEDADDVLGLSINKPEVLSPRLAVEGDSP
jgi:dihydrolipoamide dehydrogenase